MTGYRGGEGARTGVYLDNAATTYPKPEKVYLAVERFMREEGGSAGRSGHARALGAGRVVYRAREAVARLLSAGDPLRVAFTKNATEAINIALKGVLKPGDHVVVTSVEHNSVMRPLEALRAGGVRYSVARCGPDGGLDPDEVRANMTPGTVLVVVNHVSNVTGTVLPVSDVAEVAREKGALVLVDSAQGAGRLAIDVEALGIDMLAFTGHKELFGPQGTGGLWVREGVDPGTLVHGGTGSQSGSLEQPQEMPDRLESGTLNAPGIAGLVAGIEFVESEGVQSIAAHERALLERLFDGLERLEGVTVHGPPGARGRVGIVPLTFDRVSPSEAAARLDRAHGVCTRAGMHCSPMAHRTIGTERTGVLRLSFSRMNTASEVDYLLECLREVVPG